ncbi:MAG: competence protein ComK [Bacilli bacterium]|nr:competence protein ComK [Bacilli bacterium]
MIDHYEINPSTIALIAVGTSETKVLEEDRVFMINKNTTDIINHSCKYFGSSLVGRKEGTKALTGVSYKAPIIIEETQSIIFFPTSSPRFDNCSWISLNHINDYFRANQMSLVTFKNGQSLEIDISFGSLENQVLRATRLESILRHRKI